MSPLALHHRRTGRSGAPVLVLANSLGTGLAMWDSVAEQLADSFDILQFDHRGQGDSPVLPGPYSIDDLGADLLALLDSQSVGAVDFAGVSIGGMLGLWLAAHAPERVRGLVVFCSSAHPGNPDAWRERAATVRGAGSVAPVADAVVDRWLTPEFAASHPPLRVSLHSMLTASPPAGYAALCEMLAELDLRPNLGAISAPSLVVGGAQDTALPADPHSKQIAAGLPGARFELLDPAAHIPMLQRPDDVAELIARHLRAPR